MKFAAVKQAQEISELLSQISSLALIYHDAQFKKITEDANIPRGK